MGLYLSGGLLGPMQLEAMYRVGTNRYESGNDIIVPPIPHIREHGGR